MPNFARGAANVPKKPSYFEAALLPDAMKLQLCQDLLAEIGANNVRPPTTKHEIVHSCPIPGAHRNGDRNPSASLNYQRLTFNCLSCGAQGGLLWFISVTQGIDSAQAFNWLGEQTGVGGRSMDGQRVIEILEAIFNQQERRPEPMNVYPESTLDPWRMSGLHPYLADRNIPLENCQRFEVGFARAYPMGFDLVDDEKIERPPQPRIVIPIRWKGQLVGWQARAVRPQDAESAKYKNSVDCPRDRVLYGWEGPDQDYVLVESPMSVLRHVHHQPMLASFGKQLTDAQLRILQRAHSLIVWFDPDDAGWKGTRRAIDELRAYLPIRVVDWRYRGTDPADLPDDVVDEQISKAIPHPLWRRPGYENLKNWKG